MFRSIAVALVIDSVQTDHHRTHTCPRRPQRHQQRYDTGPTQGIGPRGNQPGHLRIDNVIDIIRQQPAHILQLGNDHNRVRDQPQKRDQRRQRGK